MAPKRKYVYVALGASLVCATIALAAGGSRIAIPTSTLAGQALTGAVMLGVLARGIGVADFIGGLRRRLGEKNDALRVALARIEILAAQDELTGLPNRRSVLQWLGEQLSLCERSGLPLTIALLDIDHFKRINDDFGHMARMPSCRAARQVSTPSPIVNPLVTVSSPSSLIAAPNAAPSTRLSTLRPSGVRRVRWTPMS